NSESTKAAPIKSPLRKHSPSNASAPATIRQSPRPDPGSPAPKTPPAPPQSSKKYRSPARCSNLETQMHEERLTWFRSVRISEAEESGGPSSATFEHAKAITAFIQRFGTPIH